MSRTWLFVSLLLLATGVALADPAPEDERAAGATGAKAQAEEPEKPPKAEGPKEISGMSILGNQEAPKSLVIVPWKSSEIGDSLGISTMLDDSRKPVDREVFLRELTYYQIQHDGSAGTAAAHDDAGRK
jgi:hypothetical protein